MFINSEAPWLSRSAYSVIGTDTGVFAFGVYHGSAFPSGSFRVITKKKEMYQLFKNKMQFS